MAGEAGGVVDVELVHHGLAVLLDGLDADPELVRGLLVGVAFGDELEDFGLARGEGVGFAAQEFAATFGLFVLRDASLDCGREGFVAPGNLAHRFGQRFGSGGFRDVAVDAGFEGVLDEEIVFVGGEDDDAGGGGVSADLASGIEPIEVGHGDIEGDDVGLEFGGLLDTLATVASLSYDIDVFVAAENIDEGIAHHLMVVDDENGGWFHFN